MFEQYPKVRPPLPPAIQALYKQQYQSNRLGTTKVSSLAQRMESWLHRMVASDLNRRSASTVRTLEIGAGTLNQLQYEPGAGVYDIIEPFHELYENQPDLVRIRAVYTDIRDVPKENRYDRITAIATFEHLCDLPEVIERCVLLLAEGGTLRVAIPSEGTCIWTLGWRLTTGLEFWIKHHLDYGALMRHEHVNTAQDVEEALSHFFGDVRIRVLGLSRSVSLYQFFECRGPKRVLK
jgi:trans-aconitate methyltransferase